MCKSMKKTYKANGVNKSQMKTNIHGKVFLEHSQHIWRLQMENAVHRKSLLMINYELIQRNLLFDYLRSLPTPKKLSYS